MVPSLSPKPDTPSSTKCSRFNETNSTSTDMNYELCKKLKDAGFPQIYRNHIYALSPGDIPQGFFKFNTIIDEDRAYAPSLLELIEACGEHFVTLERMKTKGLEKLNHWRARGNDFPDNAPDWGYSIPGKTPEEAVARLWLALNKNA